MEQVLDVLLSVWRVVGIISLQAVLVRLFLVLVLARIRLTDVFGYVWAGAGLITVVGYAFDELARAVAWAVLAVGAVAGVLWAVRTVRARTRDPERVLLGFFLFGRVPPAIDNRLGVTWRRPGPSVTGRQSP